MAIQEGLNWAKVCKLGKSTPKSIKIRAEILLSEKSGIFASDFEKNKAALSSLNLPIPTSNRNLIAGYITRKLKEKAKN